MIPIIRWSLMCPMIYELLSRTWTQRLLMPFAIMLVSGHCMGRPDLHGQAAARNATESSADELMQRVLKRARAARKAPPTFEFTRTKTTIHYNSSKEESSREERVYKAVWQNGRLRSRLNSVNGTAPAAKPETPAEAVSRSRQDPIAADRRGGGDSVLAQLKDETIQRFKFTHLGQETLSGRPALIVGIEPRKELKPSSIEEQVMAGVGGKIWVDEADEEIVKVDVGLERTVKIGLGGVLGALREMKLDLDRQRRPDGHWINARTEVWLHFRQLFFAKRIRHIETVGELKPIPHEALKADPAQP